MDYSYRMSLDPRTLVGFGRRPIFRDSISKLRGSLDFHSGDEDEDRWNFRKIVERDQVTTAADCPPSPQQWANL